MYNTTRYNATRNNGFGVQKNNVKFAHRPAYQFILDSCELVGYNKSSLTL